MTSMTANSAFPPQTPVAAIILAAGGSSRLGQPKQLVNVEGEPLLRRTTRTALGSRCARVCVVLGRDAPEVTKSLDGLPVEIVVNEEWQSGMASSVRRGIEAAGTHNDNDAVLLLPCDLPLLNATHLNALIQTYREGALMVASRWHSVNSDSPITGAPALFDRRYFPELMALHGDEGARKLFRANGGVLQTVASQNLAFDLDTPEDLRRLPSAQNVDK